MPRNKKVFVNPLTNPRHYNVALPNRFGTWLLWVIGPTLMAIGLVSMFLSFLWFIATPNYYTYDSLRGPFEWGAWVIWTQISIVAAGIALKLAPSANIYPHYYRIVRRGKRIALHGMSGGGFSSIGHYVVIEGLTLANEKRRNVVYVNAGDWHNSLRSSKQLY